MMIAPFVLSCALYLLNRLIKNFCHETQDCEVMLSATGKLRGFRYRAPFVTGGDPVSFLQLARLSAIMSAAGVMPASAIMPTAAVILRRAVRLPSSLRISCRNPTICGSLRRSMPSYYTLNHRFAFLKLFLVVLYFSKGKMWEQGLRFFISDKRAFDAGSLFQLVSACFSQLSGRLTTRLTESGGKFDAGSNGRIRAKSISVS